MSNQTIRNVVLLEEGLLHKSDDSDGADCLVRDRKFVQEPLFYKTKRKERCYVRIQHESDP